MKYLAHIDLQNKREQTLKEHLLLQNVLSHYASIDYATEEKGNIVDKRYLATEN